MAKIVAAGRSFVKEKAGCFVLAATSAEAKPHATGIGALKRYSLGLHASWWSLGD